MHLTCRTLGSIIVSAWVLGVGGAGFAHNPMGSDKAGDLRTLAEQSNLVIAGRVAKVEYRNLQSSKKEGAIPHTFVTYKIDDVLRGRVSGKTFTMAFIGGTDGMGGFLEVSGVPNFQPGDRDILFVAGNGEAACPLVQCEYGRFRVYESGVYNTHGSPVRAIIDENTIARGPAPRALLSFSYPAPKFDDLMRNPQVKEQLSSLGMAEAEARARYEKEAPKQITFMANQPKRTATTDSAGEIERRPSVRQPLKRQLRRPIPPKTDLKRGQLQELDRPQIQKQLQEIKPSVAQIDPRGAFASTPDDIPDGPMAVEEFVEKIRSIVNRAERKAVRIKSLAPNARIRVAGPSMRQAVRVDPGKPARPAGSAEDRAEAKMLEKQDFNPVLERR